jgi:hypothetical protein
MTAPRITSVHFPNGLPTIEAILRGLFVETSIQGQLSIIEIEDRKRIEEINTQSSSSIINEEIIRYMLWQEGYNGVAFSLIQESNDAYIYIMESAMTKTLRSPLIYTLVCLGGIVEENE